MKAFIAFNRGMLRANPAVKGWVLIMIALNMIAPIFMLEHRVALIVLATLMLSMGLMTLLTARYGFTRILGLGHILWIPLSFYLFTLWPDYSVESPVGLWLRLLTLTNLISLVFDTNDVFRYLKGDRQLMA